MIVSDNKPLRYFVWTPARGPYYSRGGSSIYVVYNEHVHPLDHLPGTSSLFCSVGGLLADDYKEAPDLDTARQMLQHVDFDNHRHLWENPYADWTEQIILKRLRRKYAGSYD